jgi:hypothetical protein
LFFGALVFLKKKLNLVKFKGKNKIDFVNSYPYQNLTNYFQNLPTTKIEIPEIKPEEIGRSGLF